jgi:hypothetical protein
VNSATVGMFLPNLGFLEECILHITDVQFQSQPSNASIECIISEFAKREHRHVVLQIILAECLVRIRIQKGHSVRTMWQPEESPNGKCFHWTTRQPSDQILPICVAEWIPLCPGNIGHGK